MPRHCLAMLTGCPVGDVGCVERYAYQKLVVGPFRDASKIAPKLIPHIKGLPDSTRKAILTLPWQYAARLDITLHLRNQFAYFENEMDPSHATAQEEVQTWLKSAECATVFRHLADAAHFKMAEHLSHKTGAMAHLSHIDSIYIYVAGDSETVKQALRQYLMQYDKLANTTMKVVTVQSPGIYHIKGNENIRSCCGGLGLTYLVLDWYLMSLSNVIYAWRKGGTRGYSTFIGTARKISGTREPTVVGEGRSVGTMTYQLVQGRNGYHFDQIHIWGGISLD
ncbi:hypothetical protein EON65_02745 [archaeon]|nr:MAG: hypothetical protein EON65_02745 [archaeon]